MSTDIIFFQETVSLTGEIYFPTIEIVKEFDFGAIPLGSTKFANIMIQNITFIQANFSWEFVQDECLIETLADVSMSLK